MEYLLNNPTYCYYMTDSSQVNLLDWKNCSLL